MQQRIRLAFALLLLAPAIAAGQALQDALNQAIGSAQLGPNARTGVFILDIPNDRILARINETTPLIPASNAKLLTSAAALRVLGPDYAFRTYLLVNEDGSITVVGSGDPGLGDPEILEHADPPTKFEELITTLARAVAAHGVESVPEIVIDDRVFDRQAIHPEWPRDQLDRHYCAPVAGVNVMRNVVSIIPRPSPSGPGNKAEAWMIPRAGWLRLVVEAVTVGEGENIFRVDRDAQGTTYTVRGRIRLPSTYAAEVAVPEPARHFGALLAQELERQGIEVGQENRSVIKEVRLIELDADQPSGEPIAWIDTPIAHAVGRCNKDSVNLYAEALLKRSGSALTKAPGSWANGAAAVRSQIVDHLGHEHAASTIISDGSGLSRENQVRADTLARWLVAAFEDSEIRKTFLDSLPTVGEGTLTKRFRKHKPRHLVLAKTGTINGVSALSGYVIHEPSGYAVAFAIINNDLKGARGTRAARALQESIVLAIDRYVSQNAPASGEAIFGG